MGRCGSTHWAAGTILSICWAPNFLAQTTGSLSVWQSGGFVLPIQYIPTLGQEHQITLVLKGGGNFRILLGKIHLTPAFNMCVHNLRQKETFDSSAGGTVAFRPQAMCVKPERGSLQVSE